MKNVEASRRSQEETQNDVISEERAHDAKEEDDVEGQEKDASGKSERRENDL